MRRLSLLLVALLLLGVPPGRAGLSAPADGPGRVALQVGPANVSIYYAPDDHGQVAHLGHRVAFHVFVDANASRSIVVNVTMAGATHVGLTPVDGEKERTFILDRRTAPNVLGAGSEMPFTLDERVPFDALPASVRWHVEVRALDGDRPVESGDVEEPLAIDRPAQGVPGPGPLAVAVALVGVALTAGRRSPPSSSPPARPRAAPPPRR